MEGAGRAALSDDGVFRLLALRDVSCERIPLRDESRVLARAVPLLDCMCSSDPRTSAISRVEGLGTMGASWLCCRQYFLRRTGNYLQNIMLLCFLYIR